VGTQLAQAAPVKRGRYQRSRDLRLAVTGWVIIILAVLLCCGIAI